MADVISSKRLPSKGTPGNLYFNNVEKTFHLALGDGTLLPVEGMLTPNPRGVVGPQGEPGPQGASGRDSVVPGPQGQPGVNGSAGPQGATGPKGSTGAAGHNGVDGLNGKDSTIAGPQGPQGIAGPQGPKGEASIVFPTDSEVADALVQLRKKWATAQAVMLAAIADSDKLHPSTRQHVKLFLNRIKREAGI